jgi:hypothetical protein
MRDAGVVYVAMQDLRFLCEAMASAESVRRVLPDLPVHLFTDLLDGDRPIAPFDGVTTVRGPLPATSSIAGAGGLYAVWARGWYAKIGCMARSPYRRTVYLDTDTRVRSRAFAGLFDHLEHATLAMVPCQPSNSRCCRLYGPMFNTGVFAYRQDQHSERMFADWDALQRQHLEWAAIDEGAQVPYLAQLPPDARRFLLIADQVSLARLVSPDVNEYGMAVTLLPDIWNARNWPRYKLWGVIVDHANRHKVGPSRVASFLARRGLDHLYDPARLTIQPRWGWDLRRLVAIAMRRMVTRM